MKNKEISVVVKIAKAYVDAGYKIGQAINIAQKEVREAERVRYEK